MDPVSEAEDLLNALAAGGSPADLAALVRHLDAHFDAERASLADELHDVLGALLIAAKMDLSSVEDALGGGREDLRRRLSAMREHLDQALAAERRIAEQLQPGLLTHLGLFAALRWYVGSLEAVSQWRVRLELPEEESSLCLAARVSLYRAVQELLVLPAADVELSAAASVGMLTLRLSGLRIAQSRAGEARLRLLAVLHRTKALGGTLGVAESGPGVLELRISVPLPAALPALGAGGKGGAPC